jgi:hypothetical protein
MTSARVPLRGRIFFRRDLDTQRFILRWTRLEVNEAVESWGPPNTDFPSAVEAIAYGKNLALKHLTEQGLGDAVDDVDWWIKGDDIYYCPACLSPLSEGTREKEEAIPENVLVLHCAQGHTIPNIPADAFAFAPQ